MFATEAVATHAIQLLFVAIEMVFFVAACCTVVICCCMLYSYDLLPLRWLLHAV